MEDMVQIKPHFNVHWLFYKEKRKITHLYQMDVCFLTDSWCQHNLICEISAEKARFSHFCTNVYSNEKKKEPYFFLRVLLLKYLIKNQDKNHKPVSVVYFNVYLFKCYVYESWMCSQRQYLSSLSSIITVFHPFFYLVDNKKNE